MRIVKIPGIIGSSASPGVSAAVWFVMLVALYAVSAMHESVLPARFLLDKSGILERMRSDASFKAFGDSFDNLASIFNLFGFESFAISLAGFIVASFSMLLAIWRSGVASLKPAEFGLVSFWLINQTIYIGVPSKEIVISVLVLLLLLYSTSRAILPLFVILAALITVYFRQYWGITIIATVALYLLPRGFRRPIPLLLFALFLFTIVAFVFQVALGQPLDFARQIANEWRDPTDAASIIVPFIKGSGVFIGVANAAITLVTFVFPLRLITSGAPLQMLGGVGLFFTFWIAILRLMPTGSQLAASGRFDKLCLCVLVSFLVTQAIFEPDYGSFLKHLSPMSPLILYLVLHLRRNEGAQNNRHLHNVDNVEKIVAPNQQEINYR